MPLSVALGLWLAAAPTPFFWPKPEVVEEIDMPDVVKADGVPVRMHILRSKKGIQELLDTFANAFVHAGFYVAPVQQRHIAEAHVTGLDWRGMVSYTAILSPNPDGTTTCLLGEAAVGKKKGAVAGPDFAPLFPGASAVMRVDQEGARIVSYRVHAKVEEVVRFYGEQLKKAGYRAVGDRPGVFEKEGAEISVLPRSESDGDASVVLVQNHR